MAIVKAGKSNICKVMVWGGYAWVYKKYCKKPFCEQWEKAEAEARAKKRGQWQDKKPVPPWEWRKRKRRAESKKSYLFAGTGSPLRSLKTDISSNV